MEARDGPFVKPNLHHYMIFYQPFRVIHLRTPVYACVWAGSLGLTDCLNWGVLVKKKGFQRLSSVSILLLVQIPLLLAACGAPEATVEILPSPSEATVAPTESPTSVPTEAASPTATTPPTRTPTATPASVPTVESPSPPATPLPTAAETSPPAPTSAPTVAGTPVVCDEVPIRGFGKVWAEHPEVQQGLGCPNKYYYCDGGYCSGEQPMVSAVQRFEHGTMIWVNQPTWEGTVWVYVLFEDGTYQRFRDTFVEGVDPESDPDIVPPEGLYQPIRGFGKVWREGTGAQVRERLGWAIEPEQGGDGAWQEFWRGTMFWIGPVDRIYVIYEYDTDYNRVNTYQEFADTF
jgi:hypothetical protein